MLRRRIYARRDFPTRHSKQMNGAAQQCRHNSGHAAYGVIDLVGALKFSSDVFFYNLGTKTDAGGAPSDDPVKARALLAKAAETNSAEAQYQLGLMSAEGVGGPQDDAAARAASSVSACSAG